MLIPLINSNLQLIDFSKHQIFITELNDTNIFKNKKAFEQKSGITLQTRASFRATFLKVAQNFTRKSAKSKLFPKLWETLLQLRYLKPLVWGLNSFLQLALAYNFEHLIRICNLNNFSIFFLYNWGYIVNFRSNELGLCAIIINKANLSHRSASPYFTLMNRRTYSIFFPFPWIALRKNFEYF